MRLLFEMGGKELFLVHDNQGCTVLHDAAMNPFNNDQAKQAAVVRALVELGGRELLFATNEFIQTALHMSAQCGGLALLELLIDLVGLELVFCQNQEKQTALYASSWEGQKAAVEYLLKVGGKELLFTRNFKGQTMLFRAIANGGHENAARVLIAASGKQLVCSASCGSCSVVHVVVTASLLLLLCEVGGKEVLMVNLDNLKDWLPLHSAATKGNEEVCKVLAELRGKKLVEHKNSLGYTAQEIAKYAGHTKLVEHMLFQWRIK